MKHCGDVTAFQAEEESSILSTRSTWGISSMERTFVYGTKDMSSTLVFPTNWLLSSEVEQNPVKIKVEIS